MVFALGLQCFHLDWQAVTIPARDIVNLLALIDLEAAYYILLYLVQGMSDVQATVGVRRAIV